MKTLLLFLLFFGALCAAEPQTLFSQDMEHGWYMAPVFKVSVEDPSFNDFGVNAGWIINHRFSLGAAAYAMTAEPAVGDDGLRYSLGYGGVLLDFEPDPDRLVHVNCQLLVGGGAYSYFYPSARHWRSGYGYDDRIEVESDAFFIVEPAVNVIVNLTKHARLGGGASYRYVEGVDAHGFTDRSADGLSAQLFVKFGSF